MGKLILVISQWVRYPFKIANFVFNRTFIETARMAMSVFGWFTSLVQSES